jgi:methionine synthase II (cobalamin-independent)
MREVTEQLPTAKTLQSLVQVLSSIIREHGHAINLLIAQGSAYTVTNGLADRSYNANATTVDELADVIGTMIADLKAKGILT